MSADPQEQPSDSKVEEEKKNEADINDIKLKLSDESSESESDQEVQSQLKALEEKLQETKDEKQKMEEIKAKMHEEILELVESKTKLKNELEEVQTKLKEELSSASSLRSELQKANEEIEKLRKHAVAAKDLENAATELASLRKKVSESEALHSGQQAELNELKAALQDEQRSKDLAEKRAASLEKELTELQSTYQKEKSTLSSQVEDLTKQLDEQRAQVTRLEQQIERSERLGAAYKRTRYDVKMELLYQSCAEKIRKRINAQDLNVLTAENAATLSKASEVLKQAKHELDKVSVTRKVKRSQVDYIKRAVNHLRSEKKKLKLLKNEFVSNCNALANSYNDTSAIEATIQKWEKRLDAYLRGKLKLTEEELPSTITECTELLVSHDSSLKNIQRYKESKTNSENKLKDQTFHLERILKQPGYGVPQTPPEMETLRRQLEEERARLKGKVAADPAAVVAALLEQQPKLFSVEEYGKLLKNRDIDPNGDEIPLLVAKCIDYLEDKALSVEDILGRDKYKAETVKKIKDCFDDGTDVDLVRCTDYYVIGELFKAYFRELKEPLLTSKLYSEWLKTNDLPEVDRAAHLQECIKKLPTSNRNTLAVLIIFLCKLSRQSAVNKMTKEALARIFGGLLLREQ